MAKIKFLGQGDVAGLHWSAPMYELDRDTEKSLNGSGEGDNWIIHGDNLSALKSLLPHYARKVKCVYIDPPYNTNNDSWVYNDKVNSPLMKEWLGKVVDINDQSRHDKWLCMMYPRLQLLRELLTDDGVIFISIDDNEQHRLRMLMDDIFGEDNFESLITWRRRHNQPNDKTKMVAKVAEYIMVYAKDSSELKKTKAFNTLPISKKREKDYKNPDNDKRGKWDTTPWKSASGQGGTRYEIITPTGEKFYEEWMGTKDNFDKLLADKRIIFSKNGDGLPRKKIFWGERIKEGQPAHNFWKHEDFGSNSEASTELNEILGNKEFDNPKPKLLIESILSLATRKDSIILDSFAGSGTAAHATLALNKQDMGNRKFILVECEDYADKTTAERVRRVIKGVPTAKNEDLKKELGGSFTYFTLGAEIDPDKLLSGESMPKWETLAKHVFLLATGISFDGEPKKDEYGFVGSHNNDFIYLLYTSDIDFMRSNKAILTREVAEKLREKHKNGRIIYYAAFAYMSQSDLQELGIVFCQLPWAITKRVEKGQGDG